MRDRFNLIHKHDSQPSEQPKLGNVLPQFWEIHTPDTEGKCTQWQKIQRESHYRMKGVKSTIPVCYS